MRIIGARRGAVRFGLSATLALAVAGGACAEGETDASAVPPPAEAKVYGLGSGRFVVAAEAGDEGLRLARLAEAAWGAWSGPLGLPDSLPAAITVRLAPVEQWNFKEPWWRVAGEPGGVVSVWIRAGGGAGPDRERRWLAALAEGVSHRRAMLLGIGPERMVIPSWLVVAAAEAALARENPALLDSWRQAALRAGDMPSLRATLEWTGAQESPGSDPRRSAAYGVWQWLQAESGRSGAWSRFLAALLGGATPGSALVGAYPVQLGGVTAAEIELAWQTGVAGQARARALPLLDAEESRRLLEEADRIVALPAAGGEARVLFLGELWRERADAFVAAERQARIDWLAAHFARMHPFYSNAAGSFGRVLLALRAGDERGWLAASAEWRHDFAAGRELERASAELLDAAAK